MLRRKTCQEMLYKPGHACEALTLGQQPWNIHLLGPTNTSQTIGILTSLTATSILLQTAYPLLPSTH